jgi:hypothetical protein
MRAPLDREATAYHEAGHFVMAYLLRLWGWGQPQVRRVTIPRNGEVKGLCRSYRTPSFRPDVDESPRTELRLQGEIMAFFAGTTAESRYRGCRTARGAGHDRTIIADLVSRIAAGPDEERACLRWLSLRTERLVAAHWPTVELVAQALLARGTLTGKQLVAVIREADAARVAAARAKVTAPGRNQN